VYAVGGLRVVGFVVQPPAPAPAGGHPVILWLRGGNRDLGKVSPFHLAHMLDLAEAGFVVVATQYRGVDGGDGQDEFGGRDVADVHALVPLARRLPGADATRLFLVGNSRGAMSGLVAMRQGLPVRAAAFRSGMYDLERTIRERPGLEQIYVEIVPEWTSDRAGALRRRSPIRWTGALRAPILVLQARQDWRTSLDGALAFHLALGETDLEHALVIYERDEHQLAFHRREWLAETVAWFRRHDAPAAPR
ncbi:MAG: prolyl oligopeptidase family serine peptidase, partial [Deltaproteobacteria bacterium]|nr:prolyl oligopeptidase family serine peptidase [Kofleriaceae bacterium]